MFYGEYRHAVDEKGRLIMPSRLRLCMKDNYIDKFFITRGLEKCLFAFTEREWTQLEQKFKALPITQGNARAFGRILFSGAFLADCDKQGRINIPQHLLNYAGIEKEVVVVGVSTRIEIWNLNSWDNFVAESLDSYEKTAEAFVDLGI